MYSLERRKKRKKTTFSIRRFYFNRPRLEPAQTRIPYLNSCSSSSAPAFKIVNTYVYFAPLKVSNEERPWPRGPKWVPASMKKLKFGPIFGFVRKGPSKIVAQNRTNHFFWLHMGEFYFTILISRREAPALPVSPAISSGSPEVGITKSFLSPRNRTSVPCSAAYIITNCAYRCFYWLFSENKANEQ